MKKIRHIIVLLLSMGITCAYANNESFISIEQILEQKQSTMLDVLKFIETETGYVFFYSDEIKSELNRKAQTGVVKGSIQEILNPLFEKTELTYQINGNQVVVKRKAISGPVSLPSVSQKKSITVTGVITDETGEPLIGANIWLKNSSTGAVTDIDGKYTIKVDGVGGVLTFSYMGMKSVDIAIGNQTTNNVTLVADDEVLEILHEHDVTISIGDAMRPGCNYDATDAGQISELIEIGKLTKRAWDAGVQVMVEGPGHMALDEIPANMKIQKRLCHNAPFYVLGPLVTDIAPGYDHITSAIGGAVAASCGADFLCYVTPAEHLRLPDADDVREGLVATKIAAHAADIAKGIPHARDVDNRMSDARRRMDWEEMFSLAIDPVKPRKYFESAPPSTEGTCTMCGKMCAVRTVNTIMDGLTIDLGEEMSDK